MSDGISDCASGYYDKADKIVENRRQEKAERDHEVGLKNMVIKPKDIVWKEAEFATYGFIAGIKLFVIQYDSICRRDKNPYNLSTILPGIKTEEVDSIEFGKIRAYKMVEYFISLLVL